MTKVIVFGEVRGTEKDTDGKRKRSRPTRSRRRAHRPDRSHRPYLHCL